VPNLDLPPPASHPLPLAKTTLKQHPHTGTELVGLDRAPGPALELPSDNRPPGNHEGHDLRLEYQ
jgi:hypothetical protein